MKSVYEMVLDFAYSIQQEHGDRAELYGIRMNESLVKKLKEDIHAYNDDGTLRPGPVYLEVNYGAIMISEG